MLKLQPSGAADVGAASEHEALAEGLARLLGNRSVSMWVVPASADPVREVGAKMSNGDVAVLRFERESGAPESLADALEAVRAADLKVAWSGLTRNSITDIHRETPLVVAAADLVDDVREVLATGTASLLFDEAVPSTVTLSRPVRVCIASYEVVGPTKNGGIGTANTSLAELLAAAGHDVTLLYTGWQRLDEAARERWTSHYDQRGVQFRELAHDPSLVVDTPQFNQARAYELYRWLVVHQEEAWDVVHVPECQGHGYYALLARRLGLAFDDCTFVVGVHSPTRWVYEANRWTLDSAHRLADDFMERRCVELADVVISPSAYLLAWMERHGWNLPERRFVQQYATSGAVVGGLGESDDPAVPLAAVLPDGPGTRAARDLGYRADWGEAVSARETMSDSGDHVDVEEVIFFGRLETRKGLETFCDALDILAEQRDGSSFRITFMGSETPIDGVPAGEYLRQRSRRWRWQCQVESSCNQLEAVAYIRQPGRLVVMPSPVDNSPNTVLEALGLNIPFITSRGGGIPELIHPLDLDKATFAPVESGRAAIEVDGAEGKNAPRGAEALAHAIRQATAGDAPVRPRFAVDPEANARVHVEWHERVAAAPVEKTPVPAALGESLSVCLGIAREPGDVELVCRSFERQAGVDVELIAAAPDGDADRWSALRDHGWRVISGGNGALDAAAAGEANGDWLFLGDETTLAEPALLRTLLVAAQNCDAEIVTCAAYMSGGTTDGVSRGRTVDVPLGGAALVGLFYGCFGVGGALVRRQTFEELGGFSVTGPPKVRRCDLLRRAALAGKAFTVVPDVLLDCYAVDGDDGGLPTSEAMRRTLEPYERLLPHSLADLPGVAASLAAQPLVTSANPELESRVEALQERLNVISTSRSWRMTKPLRTGANRLRGRS